MPPLLELCDVSKSFGPTVALQNVDFGLLAGEVHALVGENGAGKSTALGLMYGVHGPDAGEVRISGSPVHLKSVSDAQAHGVSCVFQELSLADGISVAENIFAGRTPTRAGLIDWRRLREKARNLLRDFSIDIDVDAPLASLDVGMRQVVEIAKALSLDVKILLLDEPTSALSPEEKQNLFTLIRRLTDRGIGVVYVSHHLTEVLEISDRITVFRDGRKVATHRASETSEAEIVTEMIGKDLHAPRQEREMIRGAPAIVLDRIAVPGRLDEISLTVHSGEILALAGMLGSGAQAVGEVIAGIAHPTSGRMRIGDRDYQPRSYRNAMHAGVAFVPEERKSDGLFMDFSIRANLISASLERTTRFGLVDETAARKLAAGAIRDFSIRTRDDSTMVSNLSGGNQQKVMLAKWLETEPRLLIVNEPTKGVDIGSKLQIHDRLRDAAARSMAVLIISSDFPELLAIADRILVVRNGVLVETAGSLTEAELIDIATGASGRPAIPSDERVAP